MLPSTYGSIRVRPSRNLTYTDGHFGPNEPDTEIVGLVYWSVRLCNREHVGVRPRIVIAV